MKKLLVISLFLSLSVVLFAQNNNMKSQKLPKGWMMRFDKTNAGAKDFDITNEKGNYYFKTDPIGAAIYYNPENNQTGKFSVEADFNQLKSSAHPEAYGIFIAGSNLQKDNQYYIYFLVRQDGKYLIKKRTGNDTKLVKGWTADKNVNAQNSKGITSNQISINVGESDVTFDANGKKLLSMSKKEIGSTDGIVGLRINHNLDVKTSGLKIK